MTDQKWLLDRAEIERLPDEPDEAWYRRVQAAVRAAADPGILALWRERGHALVRAGLRQTRRAHRWSIPVLVAVPLGILALALALWSYSSGASLCELAGTVACLWPLIMILGAGLAAADAVVAERTRDTALQLVLTVVPRRIIAAARVLPPLRPFLWGMLAALPAYLWAGRLSEFQLWHWPPNFPVLWPFRMVAVSADFYPTGLHPTLQLTNGLFMWLTDLGLVWAAAHWGAAYAVRLGNLGLAALYLAGRLALTGVWLFLCTVLAAAVGLLSCIGPIISGPMSQLGAVVFTIFQGACLAVALGVFFLLYRRVIVAAVRMALVEFAWFDRLADDEFEPRLKGARPWAIPLDPRARL